MEDGIFDEEAYCEECGVKGAYETNLGILCDRCKPERRFDDFWISNSTFPPHFKIILSDGEIDTSDD